MEEKKGVPAADPEAKETKKRALDTNFDEEPETEQFRVPRLDDLCVQALAKNLHKYPAIDHIKEEYVPAVVELVNTKAIEFTMACKVCVNCLLLPCLVCPFACIH